MNFDDIFLMTPKGDVYLNNKSALLLKDFKDVYKLRENETLHNCPRLNRWFTFLYLNYSPRSLLVEYDKDERYFESVKSSGLTDDDFNDVDFQKLKDFFEHYINQNEIIRSIASAKKLLEALDTYSKTVDLSQTIKGGPRAGSLVHSVNDVRKTIMEYPIVLKQARALRQIMKEELDYNAKSSKTKGDAEKGLYE